MFVFVKARIDQRFDSPDQLTVKVISVIHLAEVFEKFAKSITASVKLHQLSKEIIGKITESAKKHRGKCQLMIRVIDEDDEVHFESLSRNTRVDARGFLLEIEELPELSITIG